jgi:hypothetical protein
MMTQGFVARATTNFQGTIAHEFTHVAIKEHPEIAADYSAEDKKHWSIVKPVGYGYKRNQDMTEDEWASEMIAMSVAAYMYQPNALGAGGIWNQIAVWLGGGAYSCVDWRYGFVEAEANRLAGAGGYLWPWPTSR